MMAVSTFLILLTSQKLNNMYHQKIMDTSTSNISPPEHPILGTLTQMGAMNDLTTDTTQNTPQNSAQITHQLAPTKLLSRLVDDENDSSCQQEGTTQDAMTVMSKNLKIMT